MADKSLHELPSALTLILNDLIYVEVVDEHSVEGYSTKNITAAALATALLDEFEYTQDLTTQDKTIIGAINEIAQGGGGGGASVIVGTTTPTSAQGSNNDIYVKYEYDSQEQENVIVSMYVKISGEWCEVPLGGGSGSTVSITPTLATGTKIADYSIDGTSGALYAPPSGDSVSVTPIQSTGTKIATIGVNSTDYDIYAPSSSGDVALSDLTDVEITSPTDGQTLKYRAIPNEKTASGAIATFSTSYALPLTKHVVDIPYSANGYTGMIVTRCGKNLFDGTYDGYINASGALVSNASYKASNYIRVLGGEDYTLSYDRTTTGGNTGMRFAWYDENKTFISRTGDAESTAVGHKVETSQAPSTAYFVRCSCANGTNIQLEMRSTDTNFEAYEGTTTTIDWTEDAGTIYGGSLDLINGILTSTKASDGTDLAEPIEYSIDPVILEALTGRNNIWADTGDTEVKYIYDYSDLWENGESGTTTSITPTLATGTKIADYELDGVEGALYAPSSGDTVSITPALLTGTKIADYSINGTAGVLYAPTGGGGGNDEIFVIGGQIDSQSGDPVIDKTAQEIYAAITAGQIIILVWTTLSVSDTFKEVFTCTTCEDNSNGLFDLEFSRLDTTNSHNIIKTHIINDALGLSFGHFDTVKMLAGYSLYQTLEQGETSVEFVSNDFDNDRAGIDIYTDKIGVNPVSVTVDTSGHFPVMTVTFEQQASDVEVKVVVTL